MKYKCTVCGGVSTAEEIDAVTIEECATNRQLRRAYVSILKNKPKKYYKCPLCKNNVRIKGFEIVKED